MTASKLPTVHPSAFSIRPWVASRPGTLPRLIRSATVERPTLAILAKSCLDRPKSSLAASTACPSRCPGSVKGQHLRDLCGRDQFVGHVHAPAHGLLACLHASDQFAFHA